MTCVIFGKLRNDELSERTATDYSENLGTNGRDSSIYIGLHRAQYALKSNDGVVSDFRDKNGKTYCKIDTTRYDTAD